MTKNSETIKFEETYKNKDGITLVKEIKYRN